MAQVPASLLAASVTLLAAILYFAASFRVGVLRGKLGIVAPATSGHPTFERAYRVQLNTLEQMGIFLPLLWITVFYPVGWQWLASGIGLGWILGRIVYWRAYVKDPGTRLVGAGITGL